MADYPLAPESFLLGSNDDGAPHFSDAALTTSTPANI
jgi:hypothetical protein